MLEKVQGLVSALEGAFEALLDPSFIDAHAPLVVTDGGGTGPLQGLAILGQRLLAAAQQIEKLALPHQRAEKPGIFRLELLDALKSIEGIGVEAVIVEIESQLDPHVRVLGAGFTSERKQMARFGSGAAPAELAEAADQLLAGQL